MENGSFQLWKDRLLFWGTTSGIGLICVFGGWVFNAIQSQPTRDERIHLINAVSPYNNDRALIFDRLERCEKQIQDLKAKK